MKNKIKTEFLQYNEINISKVSKFLKNDELVIFPTETVFGIGGNAFSDKAIKKIFDIKKRPFFNPLIVHLKNKKEIYKYAIVNESAEKLINSFMPGPITLILPIIKNTKLSKFVTAGLDTVALRVPSNKIANNILNELDGPIAAPSANLSGEPSSTRSQDAFKTFDGLVSCIIKSNSSEIGLESTVIGFDDETPLLLRLGGLEIEKIQNVLNKKILLKNKVKNITKISSPGLTLKHYSPKAILRLNAHTIFEDEVFLGFGKLPKNILGKTLSESKNLNEAAHNYYSYLIYLDQLCFKFNKKKIAVAKIPNIGLGKTINDRLKRGAKKSS